MIKLVVVGVVLIIALAALVRLVEARFAFFPSVADTVLRALDALLYLVHVPWHCEA